MKKKLFRKKKDYLIEYFVKTDFTHLKSFLGCYDQNLFFQQDLTHVKALAYIIRIIPIIYFFQNCVYLDYLWVENVEGSARQEQ